MFGFLPCRAQPGPRLLHLPNEGPFAVSSVGTPVQLVQSSARSLESSACRGPGLQAAVWVSLLVECGLPSSPHCVHTRVRRVQLAWATGTVATLFKLCKLWKDSAC